MSKIPQHYYIVLKIFPATFLYTKRKSEIQKRISGQWRNIQAGCFYKVHSLTGHFKRGVLHNNLKDVNLAHWYFSRNYCCDRRICVLMFIILVNEPYMYCNNVSTEPILLQLPVLFSWKPTLKTRCLNKTVNIVKHLRFVLWEESGYRNQWMFPHIVL